MSVMYPYTGQSVICDVGLQWYIFVKSAIMRHKFMSKVRNCIWSICWLRYSFYAPTIHLEVYLHNAI